MRGELDLALIDLSRAVAINPNRTNYLAARGDVLNAKGELDRAIADYDRALTIAPNDKFLQERRRIAAVAREQLGGSQPQPPKPPQQAVTPMPVPTVPATPPAPGGQQTTVSQAAALSTHPKDFDKARSDYDRAIELDPKQAGAYGGKGMLLALQGEHDKALAEFDRALAINPRLSDALSNRGLSLLVKNRAAEATADFDRALE